ncbi:MAG TPA: UdgX family uracil-DNA binding protein [Bryobacteraceae bacterium]|nr:UdgX family uracil-DNA binding protein [Bryobacteraceae bacterium]
MIAVSAQNFEEWRETARKLLQTRVLPNELHWSGAAPSLFEGTNSPPVASTISVPKEFVELAKVVALHRDEGRWGLLYRVLFRITGGERDLLKIDIDDDVRQMRLMEKAVHRDMHKMTAFVRFRRVEGLEPEQYVAWHRPDHYIVEQMGQWFVARFGAMRWSILTPDQSAHWDLEKLTFGPGVPRSAAPEGDALEDLWKDYYGSIFNPARVKIKAMKAEMPIRHWATLPETEMIPRLLAAADQRVIQMGKNQKTSAAPWVPETGGLRELRAAAPGCKGCDLYQHATQVVFGEGPPDAKVVMVGEQPGDEEDVKGHPFVGPAGRLLNKAMKEAGLDREEIYVTNAVKHFKFVERGKRRIHGKPTGVEISACRPWLEAELSVIKPELLVCLGATAAQALMGRDFRMTSERGKFFPHRWAKELMATIHPSAILRTLPERYDEEYGLLVRDLQLIAEHIAH